MDRRGFVSGVGALAATAAAGMSGAASAGNFSAANGLLASMIPDASLVNIGYLPLDALPNHVVAGLRAPNYSATHYDVNLVGLHSARPQSVLQRLDIVARFAIDRSPDPASFFAWSHVAGTVPKSSAPVTFPVPDSAALQVDCRLEPTEAYAHAPRSAKLHLPIGGTGLVPGIYVVTTPSARTGLTPNLRDLVYSGEPEAPLALRRGTPLDFDHFVFVIRPHQS